MNKFWITLGLGLAFTFSVTAQDSILLRTEPTWFNKSLEETGVYGVNTEKAWNFLKDNNRKPVELIVGILDSGVQADHIDLADNMWVNPKEIAGNNKDDDKNGYIDDIHGWNFIGGADGQNIDGDTLEKVRIYKYVLLPLFESDDAEQNEKNKTKHPEKYNDYQTIKLEITNKLSEAKANLAQYNQLQQMLSESFPSLIEAFGSELVTEESLSKFEPTEETMGGMFMFGILPKEYWDGLTMEQIFNKIKNEFQGAINYFESQINYHYNVDFEPRGIVGDNYADKKEKHYGNNDVEGPDAEHGTHVAGVIAAVRGNDLGIDGIAGNHIRIMSVRTVPNGDERDKDVANAIYYAVDNGAKIINMSFGKDYSPEKEIVWKAMKYAEKKGVLMVKAAGNDNVDIDEKIHYPSNFDEKGNRVTESLLTVGASTPDAENIKASFSNYGKLNVDVFAPGTQILSTVPHDKFEEHQGTSMASPITAGVAALVWSHYPDFTANEIKHIIKQSVNKHPDLEDISITGGVVDAYKAVQLAEELYKKK